jgi:asparagine synthase (glutamine-hydrolysing)
MCGIAGFIGKLQGSSEVVHRMASTLIHRGPDGEGFWVDEEVGVALSHRQLSIWDNSPAFHQPMTSHSGRYIIVSDGEILNHLELRRELERGGLASDFSRKSANEEINTPPTLPQIGAAGWHGPSDTETLLAAIAAWGVEATLKKCVGMFAFALWDRDTQTLTLARDRMGEKPLYYGWQRGAFLFCSELKALKAHPAFRAEIDHNVLAPFFRVNFIPAPYSIYKDIKKLPAGTFLQISVKTYRHDADQAPRPYWELNKVAKLGAQNTFPGTEQDAANELERLLLQSIKSQMPADIPVGAFLSGGIDSSTVAALMIAQSSQPVHTFTVAFEEEGYNEADQARAIAEHIGTDHKELLVTAEQAIRVLPQLATIYDEPFADPAQIPTILLSELAKRHVKLCLSGDGGDEQLGGFGIYSTASQIYRKIGWIPHIVRLMASHTLKRVPVSFAYPLLKAGSRLQRDIWTNADPAHIQRRTATILSFESPEALYLELSSHWKRPDEIVLGVMEPRTVYTDPNQWIDLSHTENRMMYLDQKAYVPDGIFVKEDRAAMAASLEIRAPMLDHRIVEFTWRLPLNMKIRDGQTKWLLRQVLHRYVPKEIVEGPKKGLSVPLRDWLRGPLREWAESLLDETRIKEEGFLNPSPIVEKWIAHLDGKHDWSYYLWDVLMFQNWLEAQR